MRCDGSALRRGMRAMGMIDLPVEFSPLTKPV